MNATFFDYEDAANPLNGCSLDAGQVVKTLRSLQERKPFVCALETTAGTLLVGIGQELGSIQFTPAEGGPPYRMATADSLEAKDEFVDFLCGGTPSPIPQRYCIPWPLVERIISHFMDSGSIPNFVKWEDI